MAMALTPRAYGLALLLWLNKHGANTSAAHVMLHHAKRFYNLSSVDLCEMAKIAISSGLSTKLLQEVGAVCSGPCSWFQAGALGVWSGKTVVAQSRQRTHCCERQRPT